MALNTQPNTLHQVVIIIVMIPTRARLCRINSLYDTPGIGLKLKIYLLTFKPTLPLAHAFGCSFFDVFLYPFLETFPEESVTFFPLIYRT